MFTAHLAASEDEDTLANGRCGMPDSAENGRRAWLRGVLPPHGGSSSKTRQDGQKEPWMPPRCLLSTDMPMKRRTWQAASESRGREEELPISCRLSRRCAHRR